MKKIGHKIYFLFKLLISIVNDGSYLTHVIIENCHMAYINYILGEIFILVTR
jgi:hypothetical protein